MKSKILILTTALLFGVYSCCSSKKTTPVKPNYEKVDKDKKDFEETLEKETKE